MCVEKLEVSAEVAEGSNFGKTQMEKSPDLDHMEGICENTVSTDIKENQLTNFVPSIRCGEWSDIGSRDHMEDTHVCISDLGEKFGYHSLGGEVVSFFGENSRIYGIHVHMNNIRRFPFSNGPPRFDGKHHPVHGTSA